MAVPPVSDEGNKNPQDVPQKSEEVIKISAQSTPEKQTSAVLPVEPAITYDIVIASEPGKTAEKEIAPERIKKAEPEKELKSIIPQEPAKTPLTEKQEEQSNVVAASQSQLSVDGNTKTIVEKVLANHETS